MSDYVTLYPGVYTEREKPHAEKYLADNKAIEERGEIDVEALISGKLPEDTPGVGPTFVVREAMVRYNNEKYDPENAVLNDAEHARKLGYQDILAYPTFGAHDDTYIKPWPPAARDTLAPSHLNHSVFNYKPVYPGDTLYLTTTARHVIDLTPPEGSEFRSVALNTEGSIYNQRGEKVNDVIFRVVENVRICKDKSKVPESPMDRVANWQILRPVHYYTDDDWEFIKDIWSKEKRQGATPLYWQDVNVGDEPTWTLDGPIEESVIPIAPWGMGLGGSRTMKKEIMDPNILKTMIRSEGDGIYRPTNMEVYVPPVPDDPATVKREAPTAGSDIVLADLHRKTAARANLVNYFGRDIAIRHINNWMGDHGWLRNIRWSIIRPQLSAIFGRVYPINPKAEFFLEYVPKLKGRLPTTHGLSGDVAIVKSYVYDKYVLDNEFFVELAWWIETIDGYIWEEGAATVKLPSKN